MPTSVSATVVRSESRPGGHGLLSNDEWIEVGRSLRLSPREIQILRSIFDNETEAQIGMRLGISAHTVHTYLMRLYRKLDVGSRCELLIRVFGEYLASADPTRRPALE